MHFEITFSGHKNIRSLHPKTIEITKDSELTTNGDCIIGVNADCGCKDIPKQIRKKLNDPDTKVNFSINVKDQSFEFSGNGDEKLTFDDPNEIVLRKSDFTSSRTLAINCNKASDDVPRKIVKLLQDPKTKGIFRIEVD